MDKYYEYYERLVANRSFDYSKYLAKSYSHSTLSLFEHTKNVFEESLCLIKHKDFLFGKYSNIIGLDKDKIYKKLIKSVYLHDLGKTHYKWQHYIKNNKLREVNLRHEFIYLLKTLNFLSQEPNFIEKLKDTEEICVAILSHHSKLRTNSSKSSDRFKEIDNILTIDKDKNFIKLKQELKQVGTIQDNDILNTTSIFEKFIKTHIPLGENSSFEDLIYAWYKNSIYRYILQLSDKRASMKEQNIYLKDLIVNLDFKLNSYWKLRRLQELCKENSDSELLILRAPTGGGKTLASIIWGVEQIDKNRCDRIIIAMPTMFTSNSLHSSIINNYNIPSDKITTQHSGTMIQKYIENVGNINFTEYKYEKVFENPITICTIDHILNSLSLINEEHQQRLFNITNSCIVLDECDFYDNFIHGSIIKLLQFTYKLKIPVLIMSATIPDSYKLLLEQYTNYKDINFIDEDSDNDRIRTSINKIINQKNKKEFDNVLYKLKNRKNVIIYCNTVDQSIQLYNYIKENIRQDVILYHSSFIMDDKIEKESKIMDMLGESGEGEGVVIMTQIGELSINISADYILTFLAPIDRLIQRFGRGCRFSKDICEVDIIIPYDERNMLYPAPYGHFDMKNKKFIANDSWNKTKKILKIGDYNFSNYINMVNDVYPTFELDSNTIGNMEALEISFRNNYIFNSEFEINEEENTTENDYKCRNIDIQSVLFIGEPKDKYLNKMEYEIDLQRRSIRIPTYRYDSLKSKMINKNILFEKENITHSVFYLEEDYYSSDIGLDFKSLKNMKEDNII